jgi:hypothetical protein
MITPSSNHFTRRHAAPRAAMRSMRFHAPGFHAPRVRSASAAIYRYPGCISYALADLPASLAAYASFFRGAEGSGG